MESQPQCSVMKKPFCISQTDGTENCVDINRRVKTRINTYNRSLHSAESLITNTLLRYVWCGLHSSVLHSKDIFAVTG